MKILEHICFIDAIIIWFTQWVIWIVSGILWKHYKVLNNSTSLVWLVSALGFKVFNMCVLYFTGLTPISVSICFPFRYFSALLSIHPPCYTVYNVCWNKCLSISPATYGSWNFWWTIESKLWIPKINIFIYNGTNSLVIQSIGFPQVGKILKKSGTDFRNWTENITRVVQAFWFSLAQSGCSSLWIDRIW